METEGEARAVSVLEYTDKRLSIVDIRWVHLEPEVAPARRPHSSLAGLAPLLSDHVVHEKAGGTLRTYIPVHVAGRNLSALEFSESLDGERDVVRHLIMRELRAVAIVALRRRDCSRDSSVFCSSHDPCAAWSSTRDVSGRATFRRWPPRRARTRSRSSVAR